MAFHYDKSTYKVYGAMKDVFFTVTIPWQEEGSIAESMAVREAIWDHLFNKIELNTAHGVKKISTPTGELLRKIATGLALEKSGNELASAHAELKMTLLNNLKWEIITIHRRA